MTSMNSFWVQIDEEANRQTLERIQSMLNSPHYGYSFRVLNREEMYPGQMVVSLFLTEEGADYYRAKIMRIEPNFVEVSNRT